MIQSKLNFNSAVFLLAAASSEQLPSDSTAEVAFIGRSNAGKSSALNTITNIKGLARTSKTPGRTQTMNFFTLASGERLVDLPGYGYAKVPPHIKERWQKAVNSYLETRISLRGLIIVMDIRHPLKDTDREIIHWASAYQVPTHVLLTKTDKISHGQACARLQEAKKELATIDINISAQLFSSLDHRGIEEAHQRLNEWLLS